MAKVTETDKRLLAIEVELDEVRGEVVGLREELGGAVRGLRTDLNVGISQLVHGLERLEQSIDRVAEIRPRLDTLEVRVALLEGWREGRQGSQSD